MKTTISIASLVDQIQGYLDRKYDYDAVRAYVFSYYEAEEEFVATTDAEELLWVLLPYAQSEEAFGDDKRETRLRRLARLFDEPPRSALTTAVAVFAMKFDEISELTRKVDDGIIPDSVYRGQLEKLSPVDFDVELIVEWARRHKGDVEPQSLKIK